MTRLTHKVKAIAFLLQGPVGLGLKAISAASSCFTFVVLLPLQLVLPAAADVATGPVLTVQPETVRLDILAAEPGQTHFPASFTLTNSGDAPLILSQPRTSCGCTKAQLSDYELAPEKSANLTATIDITGRYGAQRFTVFVASNAPDSPRRLFIEASVPDTRTGWQLMPAMLHVRDSAPLRLNIRLFDQDTDLRVNAVELPEGCQVLTALPLLIPAGGIGRIELRCNAKFVATAGQHVFVVHTDHSGKASAQGWLSVRENIPVISPTNTAVPANTSDGSMAAAPIVPIEARVLQQLLESQQLISDLQVLDVRSAQEYNNGHIPHSVSYPSTSWQAIKPPWPATAMLVIVAQDNESAARAAEILASTACRHVLTLQGGINTWIAAVGKNALVTGNRTESR